jgi:1-acyl-sn-glycerol-3-phosphate acyltransferase
MSVLARRLLRLAGWQVVGDLPEVPQMIAIVAPHTSNWDLPIGLLCAFAIDARRRWTLGFMMKHSAFRGPLGPIMRYLGGIPVDRAAAHDVVDQMCRAVRAHERFVLVITPEGTRRRRPYWKSGFYFIARRVGIPVVPAALDYGRRQCRIGPPLTMTGDQESDLDQFRRFFGDARGKRPERAGEIVFRPDSAGEGRGDAELVGEIGAPGSGDAEPRGDR